MARSDLVKALLRSHQRGDDAGFQRAAKDLIDDERRKRHDLVADQLEAILDESGRRRRPLQVSSLRPLPKTRDDLPLISMEEPRLTFRTWSCPNRRSGSSTRWPRSSASARRCGLTELRPDRACCWWGLPGCGKSASAEAMAGHLGLPIARVQLATVVSSYLGETARNLNQIFSFLDVGSWVLIFDEFDMLGRERADRADHGELRRVVAAMLQVVDDHRGDRSSSPPRTTLGCWTRPSGGDSTR